jgi:hypothetical protein
MKATERTTQSKETYELSFLTGATFLGFLMPLLLGLADDPYLPAAAFEKMVFFTILCATAMGIGWAWGARPFAGARCSFDERRLFWAAAGRYPFTKESFSLNLLPVSRCDLSTTSPYSIPISSTGKARELA